MKIQPDHNYLYSIAENQAGYFTANQAHSADFSKERLYYYVTTGKFSRVHRGIYRLVQFSGSPFEDLFVAWLKTGWDSVISHESALYLNNLSDILPSEVHVIMPRTGSRRRKGIRLYTNRQNPDEITHREGLPVTTADRTIIDVAASGLGEEQIRKAIHKGIRQGLISKDKLRSMAFHRRTDVLCIIGNILDSEIK